MLGNDREYYDLITHSSGKEPVETSRNTFTVENTERLRLIDGKYTDDPVTGVPSPRAAE